MQLMRILKLIYLIRIATLIKYFNTECTVEQNNLIIDFIFENYKK